MTTILNIVAQRTIELLIFYLIIANIYGFGLKAAIIRLVTTKQRRFLYGNVIAVAIYLPIITWLILTMENPMHPYLIDSFFRGALGFYLLRRRFNLDKYLMSTAFLWPVLLLTIISAIFINNHTMIFFVLLTSVLIAAFFNVYKHVYAFFLNVPILQQIVSVMSFIVSYFFFSEFFFNLYFLAIFPFSLLIIYLNILSRRKFMATMHALKKATTDEFHQQLQQLATEYEHVQFLHQYIIQPSYLTQFHKMLVEQLETRKSEGTMKEFECFIREDELFVRIAF